MRLTGKVAIVTGAASGIGQASAKRLAQEGATVVLTDIQAEAGERVAREIGPQATFQVQDVTREDAWQALFAATLRRHGRFDILANVAGVPGSGDRQDPERCSLEEWRKINSVNLEGVFLGCKHAIPAMRQSGGGAIVNVSSLAAMIATPPMAAYGAGKAGVCQLTKSVALHCARRGYRIRCNSIHPGIIDTPMGQTAMSWAGADLTAGRERYRKMVPLGVLGEPDDIAWTLVFLASDEAKFITGAEFVVDGGMSIY